MVSATLTALFCSSTRTGSISDSVVSAHVSRQYIGGRQPSPSTLAPTPPSHGGAQNGCEKTPPQPTPALNCVASEHPHTHPTAAPGLQLPAICTPAARLSMLCVYEIIHISLLPKGRKRPFKSIAFSYRRAASGPSCRQQRDMSMLRLLLPRANEATCRLLPHAV